MAGKKKFLVTVDGSVESRSMIQYVAAMLSPADTEIVLLHVLNRIPETYWDFGQGVEADALAKKIKQQVDEHEQAIKTFMESAKEALLKANFREENIAVHIQDRVLGIARDIVAKGRQGHNGLILGRTGTGQMKGLAMGSVSTKIIGALSDLPICVVAGAPTGKNAIVALDGSAGSMRALDYACALLDGLQGKIILFHALRRIGYPEPATGRMAGLEEVEKSIWKDAKKMLEPTLAEAKERLAKAGRSKEKIATQIVTGVSSRAGALLEEAGRSDCGSIFVGRTGISQVEDFNIGRVANKVVYGARDQAVWIIP